MMGARDDEVGADDGTEWHYWSMVDETDRMPGRE